MSQTKLLTELLSLECSDAGVLKVLVITGRY